MDSDRTRKVAMERWKLLIDVLIKRKRRFDTLSSVSVRRFSSFGLLQTKLEAVEHDTQHRWYRYTSPNCDHFSMLIRHLYNTFEVDDLLGFNNTGNICVWPSEEVLSFYILKHLNYFKGSTVIELGGGMTCLAGMALAVSGVADKIILTDGNEKATRNLEGLINRNKEAMQETEVKARTLVWDDIEGLGDLEEAFDFLICADCLFFDGCREDLANMVYKLLKPRGEALMFAPRRGKTFEQFSEIAMQKFTVKTSEKYDDLVWNLHTQNVAKGLDAYDANIHYPLFMNLTKLEV